MLQRLIWLPPLLLVLAPALLAQRGALTQPRNLVQLTSRATTIVNGRVVAARVEPHPQYQHLKSVVVTLSVQEVLKGNAGAVLTFRQFIWDPRDIADRAGYRVGDRLVLFLNPTTSAGFTTPVGLEQGRFHLQRDSTGTLTAVNGHDNENLFTDMENQNATARLSAPTRLAIAQRTITHGPVPLAALRETVRALVNNPGATQ